MKWSEEPFKLERLTVDPRAWPQNKPRTKKMNFPVRFRATTEIHGASKRIEEVEFEYHKSRQNRDTFIAVGRSWLLKGMMLTKKTKKCANQPVPNQCLDEWQSYLSSDTLRPYLPVVFGYCEVMPENVPVACLLMERVAFTWDEFKEKMHRAPLREANLLNAVVAQCQIVAFFNEVAQARIPLTDAHGGNLCFVDNSLATVRLIDWCGDEQVPRETFYMIMKRSIDFFFKFSPGAHTHDQGAGQKELLGETPGVQENILRWTEFLQQVSQRVNNWFAGISQSWNLGVEMQEVPMDALERLRRELSQLAMAVMAKAPSRTSCSAASGGQTSAPSPNYTRHSQISDDEASEKEEESDKASEKEEESDVEMSCEVPDWGQTRSPSFQWSPSPPFRWGATAHMALCLAAQQQLDWMRNNDIRHGRPANFSKTLEQRIVDDDFGRHDGGRPVEKGHELGDRLGLLLTLVLQHLADRNYLDRCESRVPAAAINPRKLHRSLYNHWGTTNADWDILEEPDQRQRLRGVLFKMWTTDKKGQVMRPSEEQQRRRCEASWNTFWLNDHELDTLVASVISTYRAQAQFV